MTYCEFVDEFKKFSERSVRRTLPAGPAVHRELELAKAALGVVGESFELYQAAIGVGAPDDKVEENTVEELGDVLFYFGALYLSSCSPKGARLKLWRLERNTFPPEISHYLLAESVKKILTYGCLKKHWGVFNQTFNRALRGIYLAYPKQVSEAMKKNSEKLLARYPDGFDPSRR